MAAQSPVIVTCAITGAIQTPSMSPHLPATACGRRLAATKAEQAARAWRLVEALGRSVATPGEVRAMLGLKGKDRVEF